MEDPYNIIKEWERDFFSSLKTFLLEWLVISVVSIVSLAVMFLLVGLYLQAKLALIFGSGICVAICISNTLISYIDYRIEKKRREKEIKIMIENDERYRRR